MFWKTPPSQPGIYQTGTRDSPSEVNQLPAGITHSRYALGSADMNECHFISEIDVDLSVPKPTKQYNGKTYLFHRSELLGDLVHSVYLEDVGDEIPASIQGNYDKQAADLDAELLAKTDPKARAVQLIEQDYEQRKQQLPEHLHGKLDELKAADLASLEPKADE